MADRCNADVVSTEDGGIERNGLTGFWHELENYNSAGLVGLLGVRKRPIILDWAYPPYRHSLRMVRAFMAADIRVWWFDADAKQARESNVRRENHTLNLTGFDNQANLIKVTRSELLLLYRERFLCTLDASGMRMSGEQIMERIREIDPLPWLPELKNEPPGSQNSVIG